MLTAYIAFDVYLTAYDDYHIPSNERNDDYSTEKLVSPLIENGIINHTVLLIKFSI